MLQALAVVMAQQEPARVKFMDANMMPPIIAALGVPSPPSTSATMPFDCELPSMFWVLLLIHFDSGLVVLHGFCVLD